MKTSILTTLLTLLPLMTTADAMANVTRQAPFFSYPLEEPEEEAS